MVTNVTESAGGRIGRVGGRGLDHTCILVCSLGSGAVTVAPANIVALGDAFTVTLDGASVHIPDATATVQTHCTY